MTNPATNKLMRPLLAAFFLAAAVALGGCVPWQTPEIKYVNTEVGFSSFDSMLARSFFSIKNPNPFALHGKVEYELLLRGDKFLGGQSDIIQMPANGEASFVLESRVEIVKAFGVLSDLVKEIQAGRKTIPFEINGAFKSDIVNIPVEAPIRVSGELPLPELPKVDFQSLSLSSLSLDGSTLKLKVKIKNNNDFPIKIDPFPYQLLSEGKELLSGSFDAPINIPAQDTRDVSLDIKVNFSQLSQSLLEEIKNQSLQAEVKSNFSNIR